MRKLISLAVLATLVSSCGKDYKTEATTKELTCFNNYEIVHCTGDNIVCTKAVHGTNTLTCTLTTVVED